jgi:hypothetical protein
MVSLPIRFIQQQARRLRYFPVRCCRYQSGLGDSSCGPGCGTLRGFTNKNASFAPAASPGSDARHIGPVIIANLQK